MCGERRKRPDRGAHAGARTATARCSTCSSRPVIGPSALAVTLTSLAAQTLTSFRVVVSDQSERPDLPDGACAAPAVLTPLRLLRGARASGARRTGTCPGAASPSTRQFLLDQATARYALFLDDDVLCEPDVLERLLDVMLEPALRVRRHAAGRAQPSRRRPPSPAGDRALGRSGRARAGRPGRRAVGAAPPAQRRERVARAGTAGAQGVVAAALQGRLDRRLRAVRRREAARRRRLRVLAGAAERRTAARTCWRSCA